MIDGVGLSYASEAEAVAVLGEYGMSVPGEGLGVMLVGASRRVDSLPFRGDVVGAGRVNRWLLGDEVPERVMYAVVLQGVGVGVGVVPSRPVREVRGGDGSAVVFDVGVNPSQSDDEIWAGRLRLASGEVVSLLRPWLDFPDEGQRSDPDVGGVGVVGVSAGSAYASYERGALSGGEL